MSSDIWNKYWQANRTASCFDNNHGNYEGPVWEFWTSFFQQFSENKDILDLCTGNGAALRMAADIAHDQGMDHNLTGIDAADIDPLTYVENAAPHHDAITFMGGIDIEAAPFEDASFDIITSQYGIEYTNLSKSLPMVGQTLRPDGQFCFVMHANEGVIKDAAVNEMNECRFLTDQAHLFRSTIKALNVLKTEEVKAPVLSRPSRIRIGKAVKEFENAVGQVRDKSKLSSSIMHDNAWRVCLDTVNKRGHFPLPVLVGKIKETELEVKAHHGRLRALVAASVSRNDVEKLGELLASSGLIANDPQPLLDENEDLIGWVLRGKKHQTN